MWIQRLSEALHATIIWLRAQATRQSLERGQGLVEYGLLFVLVVIIVIVLVSILGPWVGNIYSNVINNL
jgi:pilus assembly protein Flp/PilA